MRVSAIPNLSLEAGQEDGSTTAASLLYAPQPWLLKLISGDYLDSDSKLSLFQTCRQLNEFVMQHSQRSTLSLDLSTSPSDTAYKKLQHVSSNTKLRLHHPSGGQYWGSRATMQKFKQMGQTACSLLQAAAKQGCAAAVCTLHLEHVWLETILPPTIGQACPNLTKLILSDSYIRTDGSGCITTDVAKLRCLELRGVQFTDMHGVIPTYYSLYDINLDASRDVDGDVHAHDKVLKGHNLLRAQLRGLPALQSLTIHGELQGHDCTRRGVMSVGEVSVVNALAGQLTHLCIKMNDNYCVGVALRHLNWAKLGSTLSHLHMYDAQLYDADLSLLLQLPMLSHIEVYQVLLRGSFVGKPCKWQELRCYVTSVEALAHLPLHPDMLLKVANSEGCAALYLDGCTPDMAQQAIANIRKGQGVVWGEESVRVLDQDHDDSEVDDADPVIFAEWLTHALPLLRGIRSLSIAAGCFDGAMIQILGELVSERADKPRLQLELGLFMYDNHACLQSSSFSSACMPGQNEHQNRSAKDTEHDEHDECAVFAALIVPLVAKMPYDSTLAVPIPGSISAESCVHLFSKLCCAAERKLTVHAECDEPLPEGCMEGVRSAIQSNGHELLGLSMEIDDLDCLYSLRVTVQPRHA